MLLIENVKDQVIADWLKSQFSDVELAAAVSQLAGQRRPYVSNVVKALGVTVPPDVSAKASRAVAADALASMRKNLG